MPSADTSGAVAAASGTVGDHADYLREEMQEMQNRLIQPRPFITRY